MVAHTISARKRIRQTEKKRLANKANKSAMKTEIKKFVKANAEGNVENAEVALKNSISKISRVAGKGVIHKKQASRRVSRLTKRFNSMKAAAQQA